MNVYPPLPNNISTCIPTDLPKPLDLLSSTSVITIYCVPLPLIDIDLLHTTQHKLEEREGREGEGGRRGREGREGEKEKYENYKIHILYQYMYLKFSLIKYLYPFKWYDLLKTFHECLSLILYSPGESPSQN